MTLPASNIRVITLCAEMQTRSAFLCHSALFYAIQGSARHHFNKNAILMRTTGIKMIKFMVD